MKIVYCPCEQNDVPILSCIITIKTRDLLGYIKRDYVEHCWTGTTFPLLSGAEEPRLSDNEGLTYVQEMTAANSESSRETPNSGPALNQCRANVRDVGPTLIESRAIEPRVRSIEDRVNRPVYLRWLALQKQITMPCFQDGSGGNGEQEGVDGSCRRANKLIDYTNKYYWNHLEFKKYVVNRLGRLYVFISWIS